MGPFIVCELISTTRKIAVPIDSIKAIYDTEMDEGENTISCVQIDYAQDDWAKVKGSTEDITNRIHQKLQETYF